MDVVEGSHRRAARLLKAFTSSSKQDPWIRPTPPPDRLAWERSSAGAEVGPIRYESEDRCSALASGWWAKGHNIQD